MINCTISLVSQREQQCQRGCVCLLLPITPAFLYLPIVVTLAPTLHRIHLSVTSFPQTETYYWRLSCNKVRDALHYDLRVVLGNLSSQCCPAGSLLFADFFFRWLACCSNLQCNTFLGWICFALMEARWYICYIFRLLNRFWL